MPICSTTLLQKPLSQASKQHIIMNIRIENVFEILKWIFLKCVPNECFQSTICVVHYYIILFNLSAWADNSTENKQHYFNDVQKEFSKYHSAHYDKVRQILNVVR